MNIVIFHSVPPFLLVCLFDLFLLLTKPKDEKNASNCVSFPAARDAGNWQLTGFSGTTSSLLEDRK